MLYHEKLKVNGLGGSQFRSLSTQLLLFQILIPGLVCLLCRVTTGNMETAGHVWRGRGGGEGRGEL